MKILDLPARPASREAAEEEEEVLPAAAAPPAGLGDRRREEAAAEAEAPTWSVGRVGSPSRVVPLNAAVRGIRNEKAKSESEKRQFRASKVQYACLFAAGAEKGKSNSAPAWCKKERNRGWGSFDINGGRTVRNRWRRRI